MSATRAIYSLGPRNRFGENVPVHPVVIAELELGDIEWRVLFADLWDVPTQPRLIRDQKPSMVLV